VSTIRDYVSDAPVYARLAANRVRVGASSAWYRAAGRRIQGSRARFSNWRNRKAIARGRRDVVARGRRDVVARVGDQVRSRTPVLRNRIDPSTGRQNRDARRTGRQRDVSLGWRQAHRAPMPRARTGRSR